MPRGSAPGERRGGRKPGVPNKATREIKELAQKHGPAAIKRLVEIMTKGESEATQVAAIKELLDRGYGKAVQTHGNDPENPLPPLFVTGVAVADSNS